MASREGPTEGQRSDSSRERLLFPDMREEESESNAASPADREGVQPFSDSTLAPPSELNELGMPADIERPAEIAVEEERAEAAVRSSSERINVFAHTIKSIRETPPLTPSGRPQFINYMSEPKGYERAKDQVRDYLRSRGNLVKGSRKEDTIEFRSVGNKDVRHAALDDVKAVVYHYPNQALDFLFSEYPRVTFGQKDASRLSTSRLVDVIAGQLTDPGYSREEGQQFALASGSVGMVAALYGSDDPSHKAIVTAVRGWSDRVIETYQRKRQQAEQSIGSAHPVPPPVFRNRQRAAGHINRVFKELDRLNQKALEIEEARGSLFPNKPR